MQNGTLDQTVLNSQILILNDLILILIPAYSCIHDPNILQDELQFTSHRKAESSIYAKVICSLTLIGVFVAHPIGTLRPQRFKSLLTSWTFWYIISTTLGIPYAK